MEKTAVQIRPEQIIEIVFRRRWFLIIPFCLSMIAGLYLAVHLPKIYESSTLILVEEQRVPSDYVQSIVSTDIDNRINTISQQILSRTNLESIIKKLNLFSGPENENMLIEDKVASMRKRINIEVTQSRRQGTESFTITFRGKDPEKVRDVVNSLASYFIDENLRVREAHAMGTSEFLEGELIQMREKLEVVEEKMKNYRKKYMGELPEQLDSNLRILDRIQEQIADAKNRLVLIENQSVTNAGGAAQQSSSGSRPNRVRSIQDLRNELADLRTKYTERHPDIIKLKKQIAIMSKQKQSLTSSEEELSTIPSTDEIFQIRSLKSEIVELKRQADVYKKRVENTPKREQELMSLNRDYQNIQESYNSLLSRKLEAEISVNMEQKQKGERFRVIDSAKLPVRPVEPDMRKLFMFVLAAGLGIGGGIIFLLEYLDPSLRQVEDIERYVGNPVLATIPQIRYPEILMKERLHKILTGLSLCISLILFITFTTVIFMGHENTVGIIGALLHG